MSELNDNESEQVDIEPCDEITPEETAVGGANTWSKPIGLIAWGLLLTSININHLYLEYILPTIGVLLFYCGTRSLRCENKWFRATWIFSIIMIVNNFIRFVFSVTPLIKAESISTLIGALYLIYQLSMILTLRKALQTAFNKFGYRSKRNPLSWACVWTILVFVAAMFAYSFFLPIIIFLLIWDIAIYVSLYRIGPELDEVGYRQMEPSFKINSAAFSGVYIFILMIALIISCIYSNHLTLKSQEYHQPQMTKIHSQLIGLGFPEEILKDLTYEDISALRNAEKISVSGDILLFNSFDTQRQIPLRDASISDLSNKTCVVATTTYINLPGNELYILHHFKWFNGTPYWQDGFGIWAGTGDEILNLKDSGLLYEKDGATYKSPIPRLQNGNVMTSSIFSGNHLSNLIGGAFSFPFGSQNQRGYVLYCIKLPDDRAYTCACFSYAHMTNPIRMPYKFTEEDAMDGGICNDYIRQSYTTMELIP